MHDNDDTAGPVPFAVTALLESGLPLPAELVARARRGWGGAAMQIDAALANPDLDPAVRGPLTLAGAYAYICFTSLMNGDARLRASRAMTLFDAVPPEVADDAPGDEPSLYRNILWQLEGEHVEQEWPELLARADAVLIEGDDEVHGNLPLAAQLYTSALHEHAIDDAPDGLSYGMLQHIAKQTRELSYHDMELARPLLQAVTAAVPTASLPYSVQLIIGQLQQRLTEPTP